MPNEMPPTIPVHLTFFWLFDAHDDESHFAMTTFTQDVDHFYPFSLSRPDYKLLGVLYNGGAQSKTEFQFFVGMCMFAFGASVLMVAFIYYKGIHSKCE